MKNSNNIIVLDNKKYTKAILTKNEHMNFYIQLKKYRINKATCSMVDIESLYINKFKLNSRVYWYFERWDKKTFINDNWYELLIALDYDYNLYLHKDGPKYTKLMQWY